MASAYPGGLDSFPTTRVDATTTATTHPLDHNDANDALNKIEAELGINPKGGYATVVARLNDLSISLPPTTVRNVSGATLTKGTVVIINGSSGTTPTIVKADSSKSGNNLPAVGLLIADLGNNTTAAVLRTLGEVTDFNTSSWAEGTILWVDAATPGLLTSSQPAHPNVKQRVAVVTNQHAINGKLIVIIGAVRGDHQGTNQQNWTVGDNVGGARVLFNVGDVGTLEGGLNLTANRQWNLPDATGELALVEGGTNYHDLTVRSTEPPTPDTDTLRLYSRYIGGRAIVKQKGPSGLDVPLQPAIFQNTVRLISPNTTTTFGLIGGAVTSVGTISHPTPTAVQFGYSANVATAATINTAGGTSDAIPYFIRGDGTAGQASGFFMVCRWWFPAAGDIVNSGFVAGVTAGTLATSTSSAVVATHSAVVQQHDAAGDFRATNYGFVVRNTGTQVQVDTGIPIAINKLYDFYMFSPPYAGAAPVLSMRLDNITDSTTFSHTFPNTEAQLPGATSLMRSIIGCLTTEAVAKNIRIKKVYVETDL